MNQQNFHQTESQRKMRYLQAGDIVVSDEEIKIVTVLGSCISVILYDEQLHTGAICHALYPTQPKQHKKHNKKHTAFYADAAIHSMYEKLLNRGSFHRNIIAKVFGGSHKIPGIDGDEKYKRKRAGHRNCRSAIKTLKGLKIPIIAKEVGGKLGRRIVLFPDLGIVKVEYLKGNNNG